MSGTWLFVTGNHRMGFWTGLFSGGVGIATARSWGLEGCSVWTGRARSAQVGPVERMVLRLYLAFSLKILEQDRPADAKLLGAVLVVLFVDE